jgi:hypothetical protein
MPMEIAKKSNNPPAKPGAFKCEPLKAVVTEPIGSLSPPRGRSKQVQLVYQSVFRFLVPDVLPNDLLISTHRRNKISSRPEVLANEISLPARIHPRYVDCTLSLAVSSLKCNTSS